MGEDGTLATRSGLWLRADAKPSLSAPSSFTAVLFMWRVDSMLSMLDLTNSPRRACKR